MSIPKEGSAGLKTAHGENLFAEIRPRGLLISEAIVSLSTTDCHLYKCG